MPTHQFALVARSISLERADRPVLVDVDLTVTERSRLAVTGPNGVGKSTLLHVLAGEIEADAGSIERTPPNITVGLVRQELDRTSGTTVRELVAERTGVAAADAALELTAAALGKGEAGADDAYADALERWLAIEAADFDSRLVEAAASVGLTSNILELAPAALSGGQAARVGLLMVVLSRFDITLLDEPTNDLDLAGLELLEQWVSDHNGGLVIVSHDRSFLERTVNEVLEIDEHHHTASLFRGGWQAFLAERAQDRAHAEQRHATYVTERDRLRQREQRQREWADQGAARAKKNPRDGDKFIRAHNVAQTEKLVGKAKATKRAIERLEVVDKPWEGWDLRFTIDEAPRGATIVAAVDKAVIRRGDFEIGPIDVEIRWAERVVLLGPNGSGKTTLIQALLGRLPLASGSATIGSGVVVGELDQQRSRFDIGDGIPLGRAFQEQTGLDLSEGRSVLAKFGLDADAVGRPASALSPGERTRAQLALFQATGVNFLVLDEPTNHLDLPAIEQLESALHSYGGTLLVVTHDRRLLENLQITRSIVLGAEGSTVRP